MFFGAMAHNDAVCRRAEDAINALVAIVKEDGGMVWLQSQKNKEHCYMLTDPISICFAAPVQYVKPGDEDA